MYPFFFSPLECHDVFCDTRFFGFVRMLCHHWISTLARVTAPPNQASQSQNLMGLFLKSIRRTDWLKQLNSTRLPHRPPKHSFQHYILPPRMLHLLHRRIYRLGLKLDCKISLESGNLHTHTILYYTIRLVILYRLRIKTALKHADSFIAGYD